MAAADVVLAGGSQSNWFDIVRAYDLDPRDFWEFALHVMASAAEVEGVPFDPDDKDGNAWVWLALRTGILTGIELERQRQRRE
jgi:hypothetical protein